MDTLNAPLPQFDNSNPIIMRRLPREIVTSHTVTGDVATQYDEDWPAKRRTSNDPGEI